jgi:outer membrane lipoprotein carrier protein
MISLPMKYFFKVFLLVFLVLNPIQNGWGEESENILESIQKRYDEVHTFKAKFSQKAFVQIMDQTQQAEGEVVIKKPGKMKWVYKNPDPQTLIVNDNTFWLYAPEENQVTKASIKDIYTANTPALFLSGEGKLTDSFRLEKVIKKEKTSQVILIPLKENGGMQKLALIVDNKKYQILGSKVYDSLGNTTEIRFKSIEINLTFPDSLFDFETPEGVDLIDALSRE